MKSGYEVDGKLDGSLLSYNEQRQNKTACIRARP